MIPQEITSGDWTDSRMSEQDEMSKHSGVTFGFGSLESWGFLGGSGEE
jgi:hypothetical protein